MPLPTLLQPGFLIPPKWMSATEAERLKTQIPIQYIMNFLSDRVPVRRGSKPKLIPKSLGDKVVVLKSSTGSGKSTTLPTSIYDTFIERVSKNIIVTQPRVLTCIDIPQSILQFAKNLEFDKNIGYNTGNYKRVPKEKGIIFCTTEIITQQLLMAETPEAFMKKYQFIIIDEVHTRDLAIDRLLFLMKKLLADHYEDPECPILILTSATFDETIFIDYFGVPKENYIMVEGFVYPTERFWPKYNINQCNTYAVKKALQVHIDNIADVYGEKASLYRDIMIFVPKSKIGEDMVQKFLEYNCTILRQEYDKLVAWKKEHLDREVDELHIKNDNPQAVGGEQGSEISKAARFYILPILLTKSTFDAGGLEYQNMFSSIETISLPLWNLKEGETLDIKKKPDQFVIPSRRVIIGTNIAETGITIDSLKYCIDTGYEFHLEFAPDYAANLMCQKGCTQGMVVQRRGRVGRKSPGFWYPCFTEDSFNAMQKDQYAEVIMADPIDNILTIIVNETETKIVEEESTALIKLDSKRKDAGVFQRNYISDSRWWKIMSNKKLSIGAMDFLEMPSGPALQYAAEKLHMLGMIDTQYSVTLFGSLANLIRFIPIAAKRMIFSGFATGAAIMDLVTITAFIQVGKRGLYGKTFKMPNLLGKDNYTFIYNVLIGDELIEAILLYNDFTEWISTKLKKLFTTYKGKWESGSQLITVDITKEWCESRGIQYSGWISMISMRNVLLENLVSIGLNIYYNTNGEHASQYSLKKLLSEHLDEGLVEIRKIKEAVYEGYYCNLCQWNEQKKLYIILSRNIPLSVKGAVLPSLNPAIAKQTKPQYITITDYSFEQSRDSAIFEFNGSGFISVMDNYISVDPKLALA